MHRSQKPHTARRTQPHRADMTASHITQTPRKTLQTTPHKLRPQTPAPGRRQPPTHRPHDQTQLYTPRVTTQPSRAHSRRAHTGDPSGPKATSPTRHVTPTTTTPPHTRAARRSPRRREPRPSPLATQARPGRPSVPGRASAGSQARPVLRPGSGPPRSLTQQRTPSPSAARRSAGAPAAARKPQGRLSEERRVLDGGKGAETHSNCVGRPAASAQAP